MVLSFCYILSFCPSLADGRSTEIFHAFLQHGKSVVVISGSGMFTYQERLQDVCILKTLPGKLFKTDIALPEFSSRSYFTILLHMHYEYNLQAIGIDSTHFPYLSVGKCMGLDCVNPGAELENGSADITLRTINQEHPRQEQADFTVPIGTLYHGYFVKESTHVEVGDYLGDVFFGTVAFLMVMAGFTVSCILHLSTKLLTKNSSSIFGYSYFALAGFFRNSHLNPEPISSRTIVLVWLLFCFALTEYHRAKLRSILLLTHYSGALFENLDKAMDAMEHHGWKMVVNSSRTLRHCNGAQCTRLRELQKRSLVLVCSNMSLEEAAEVDHHFGFGSLQSDIAPHERTLLDGTKRILFVRDQLITPLYRSFAVRKKMPVLLEKLNRAIACKCGGFSTIRNRYQEPYQLYVNKHFQENSNVLTLAHLRVLFDWTGTLLLISFLIFVGEILHYRYSQPFLNWVQRAIPRLSCLECSVWSFLTSEEMQNDIELTQFSKL